MSKYLQEKFRWNSRVKWKSFSCIWLFATPWTIQSVEFSRPEYWSGQPFPSPGGLPKPGIKPRSPALQADSLPAEPQGKPKNTGVGSLSLLQWIFLTHSGVELGLLHCRRILHQLSRQRSPRGDRFPPSIKPRIFCVSGKHGNQYTTETTHIEKLNIREVKNYIRA